MRVPRVRFTVRRMMVAVAVVGFLAGLGVELAKQRSRFGVLAAEHRRALLNSSLQQGKCPGLIPRSM